MIDSNSKKEKVTDYYKIEESKVLGQGKHAFNYKLLSYREFWNCSLSHSQGDR